MNSTYPLRKRLLEVSQIALQAVLEASSMAQQGTEGRLHYTSESSSAFDKEHLKVFGCLYSLLLCENFH